MLLYYIMYAVVLGIFTYPLISALLANLIKQVGNALFPRQRFCQRSF